jgi:nitrate reductase molybdenum cofactor assembly chaperone NarJ/NarW
MRLLKLLSVLLDYPREELWAHRDELLAAAREGGAPGFLQPRLLSFATGLLDDDPMQAQERWMATFDRGRSMSLMLFEHIHGESRDRGQAMVDLLQAYRDNGFELATRELPDYLPVVLEYLSTRPGEEVRDWLSHTAHILQLLAARAEERDSPYAVVFDVLLALGPVRSDMELLRKRVSSEERDDTAEAMDRVWEEEMVRFGVEAPGDDCEPTRRLPQGARRANVTTEDSP